MQRLHCPEDSWKVKEKGRCPYTSVLIKIQLIQTIYRIILSVNQLSIYGAVAAICDEYEGHQDSTGQPVVLEGQLIVLGKVKAEAPAREELEDAKIILQKYFQQVKSLSPENRLSKFCKEAGFMHVVEVGQYFVTRNASEFQHTVACREYTLPRDDKASQPKGWIRGNMRIGSSGLCHTPHRSRDHQSSKHKSLCNSQDSVLCLGKVLQHPDSNEAWKNRIAGVKTEKSYRYYDGINGEWNIFPGFTTLQLCGKINDLLSREGQTPATFTGRILFMSMFNDISCDRKTTKMNAWQMPES